MGLKAIGGTVSPAIRKITPGFFFDFLRWIWHKIVGVLDWWSEARLKISYWVHLLKGGTFHSWYSETLNDWAKNSKRSDPEVARADKFFMESGAEDLSLLKGLGLKPEHTFLEYGCGWLRAGNFFINYLNHGNYFGNDPASERIRLGREIFSIRNIEDKAPRFFSNEDNSMTWLEGEKYDYIWSHAVFGHIPLAAIEDIIINMKKAMHKDSLFLFTYNPIPDSRDNDANALVEMDVRNFYQPSAFFERVCSENGMKFEVPEDARKGYDTFTQKEVVGVIRLS